MEELSNEVVRREPCPECGDNDYKGDNRVVYADGHAKCFACGKFWPPSKDKPKTFSTSNVSVDNLLEKHHSVIKDLGKRKISARVCAIYGYYIGSDDYGNPIQMQVYYDHKGAKEGLKYRGADKTFGWFKGCKRPQLFGQQAFAEENKRLIITEGELDAMSIYEAMGTKPWPVVSIPNGAQAADSALKDNFEFIASFKEVVLAFDMDEPGKLAAKSCAALLKPGQAYMWQLPEGFKDASDLLQADRATDIVSACWQAKPYRPDGIINADTLLDELLKEPTKGFELPYPKLSKALFGLRKGELWMFTAATGIGKSTVIHEIGYDLLMKHNQKIGILALEESPRITACRYAGIYLNKDIRYDRTGITPEMLNDAFNKTMQSGNLWLYDHFGSVERGVIMKRISYMAVALQLDFIILDHISIAVSGLTEKDEDERKTIDMLMTDLRCLVEQTGVGILCITHLRNLPAGKKQYARGAEVGLGDLRGSGSLGQLSDVVVALERDQQAEDETKDYSLVRLLKNRPIGITGAMDTLKYDHETGRLTAVSDEELEQLKTQAAFKNSGKIEAPKEQDF